MSWSIPVKTEFMKTQAGHEPSMKYAQDIHETAKEFFDFEFNALEIGMAWGFSTLALLEAGAKLISVDPNHLAKGHDEALANGYTEHIWTACKSKDFWEENPNVSYDLIYVDGSHLYDDVKLDLDEAWKRLDRGGVLMVDDWEHKNNIKADPKSEQSEYGVSLACWEFYADKYDEISKIGIRGRVLWFLK